MRAVYWTFVVAELAISIAIIVKWGWLSWAVAALLCVTVGLRREVARIYREERAQKGSQK